MHWVMPAPGDACTRGGLHGQGSEGAADEALPGPSLPAWVPGRAQLALLHSVEQSCGKLARCTCPHVPQQQPARMLWEPRGHQQSPGQLWP